jgi:hypothetical protein
MPNSLTRTKGSKPLWVKFGCLTTTAICLVQNKCLALYEESSKDIVNDGFASTRHSSTLLVCTPAFIFRWKSKCFIKTKLVILNLYSTQISPKLEGAQVNYFLRRTYNYETPRNRYLPEKRIAHLVNKFPTFYVTRNFITLGFVLTI